MNCEEKRCNYFQLLICGSGQIYDGTFSGTLTEGWGTAAALLRANGIRVLGESDLQGLLRELDGAGQA